MAATEPRSRLPLRFPSGRHHVREAKARSANAREGRAKWPRLRQRRGGGGATSVASLGVKFECSAGYRAVLGERAGRSMASARKRKWGPSSPEEGDLRDSALPLNTSSAEGDAIKVCVRVRPPSEGTTISNEHQGLCLSVLSSKTIRLHSKPEPKIFTFDYVANMETTQESVFSTVAKNIVESCMNGYNGTIFAYGQTGSGKTFTMMGPSESGNFTHSLRGVIPRSFEYLFFLIEREKEKAGNGKSFLCKCSFIEIYNEQIFDLLDSASAGLLLREHINKGVFVDGAVEQVLSSAAEAYQVLTMGWRNRRVASTSMNRESSRSHAVFTITVESMEKNNEVVNIRSSLLNLVDLAGSERQKDTHTAGMRLKEAGNINRSLSCLSQVMTALVDIGNGKQRHVCYRDSKLTFLLRVIQILWILHTTW
ncbi:kinesin-like protein KIF15-B, partial [Neopsephotus bourkii]|uniref:kinesin-like protein KIF15-B n=1 Tax=Neopsephotus bourkii TaxID=309878 RepID=UPI002AA51B21